GKRDGLSPDHRRVLAAAPDRFSAQGGVVSTGVLPAAVQHPASGAGPPGVASGLRGQGDLQREAVRRRAAADGSGQRVDRRGAVAGVAGCGADGGDAACALGGGVARRLERSLVESAEFGRRRAPEGEEARAGQSYVDLPCSPADSSAEGSASDRRSKTLNALPCEGGVRGGSARVRKACEIALTHHG